MNTEETKENQFGMLKGLTLNNNKFLYSTYLRFKEKIPSLSIIGKIDEEKISLQFNYLEQFFAIKIDFHILVHN